MNNNYYHDLEGDFSEVDFQDSLDMDYPGSDQESLNSKLDYQIDIYVDEECCCIQPNKS